MTMTDFKKFEKNDVELGEVVATMREIIQNYSLCFNLTKEYVSQSLQFNDTLIDVITILKTKADYYVWVLSNCHTTLIIDSYDEENLIKEHENETHVTFIITKKDDDKWCISFRESILTNQD